MPAFLFLLPLICFAQGVKYSIKGTILDDAGLPLAGVSVILVETRTGTYTDDQGQYTLSGTIAEGTYNIEYKYLGYGTQYSIVSVTSAQSSYVQDVSMTSDILNLDEVIVTGNSPTATRKQLGNAVGVVNAKAIERAGTMNPLGALAGKVPGVYISQNSGDPGGGFSIQLRGLNSINGNSEPLYIIDGVIVDNSSNNVINFRADAMVTNFQAGQNRLVDINPNDIEGVEMLSGAAAAAQYGSRAANGVIQIFTKRGKSGKPVVEFSTSASMSQLRKKVFFTTVGERFGKKGNDRLETAQDRLTTLLTVGLTEAQLTAQGVQYTKAGSANRILVTDKYAVKRYDYQDLIFDDAFGTDNHVSVRGGNDKSNYYAAFGYGSNDGIIRNTNFTKYTGRIRLDQTLSKWMTMTTGLSYSLSKSKDMPNGNNFFNPISTIFIIDNVWDIAERNTDGSLKQVELVRVNPLSTIETFDIRQQSNRVIGDVGFKIFPFKGFRIDYKLGVDNMALLGTEYRPRLPYSGVSADFYPDGYVSAGTYNNTQLNSDLLFTYETSFGTKLSSTTTAGYQYQYGQNDATAQEGRDLVPLIKTISAAANIFTAPRQVQGRFNLNGYFLQQTFGYADQLFLTVAGRIDGSSYFSSDYQTNFYPKAGLSWVASQLFKNQNIGKTISTLKLRASYGQAGNLTGIGYYDRFNNFTGTNIAGLPALVPPRRLNNPNVQPEVMTETEVGADMAFFKNRVGLNVTYYNQEVDKLAFDRPLPPSVGGSEIVTNVGRMTNRGVELLLMTQPVRSKMFTWDLGINFSTLSNKVSNIIGVLSLRGSDGAQSALNGESFGTFFGRYYARNADGSLLLTPQGLANTERGLVIAEEKYNESQLPAGAQKDRIYRYGGSVYIPMRDANGQPLTTGTQELRKVLGSPIPDWTGSVFSTLTVKKLSLNFQFDAVMGNEVYNWNRITSNNVGFGELAEKEIKGELPRGYVGSIAGGVTGSRIQEEHVEDGSYVKLREIGLTYNFGKIGRRMDNLSVGIAGRNLVSFDNYQGFDPETNSAGQTDRVRGDDFGNVPIPRMFMLRLTGRF